MPLLGRLYASRPLSTFGSERLSRTVAEVAVGNGARASTWGAGELGILATEATRVLAPVRGAGGTFARDAVRTLNLVETTGPAFFAFFIFLTTLSPRGPVSDFDRMSRARRKEDKYASISLMISSMGICDHFIVLIGPCVVDSDQSLDILIPLLSSRSSGIAVSGYWPVRLRSVPTFSRAVEPARMRAGACTAQP